MSTQDRLLAFDPATGKPEPYPSHAQQWRDWHGLLTAWLVNPWTGERRTAEDVGSDPLGRLIVPPEDVMQAAPTPPEG